MSAQYVWQELQKLVHIDHEIAQLKKRRITLQSQLALEKQQLPLLEKQAATFAHKLRDIQKQTDLCTLQINDLKDQEKTKKGHLESLRYPKEYQAIEKELANLEKQINSLEDRLLSYWEQRDELEKQHQENQALVATEQERVAQIEASIETQQIATNERLKELEVSWEEQKKQIAPELGRNYMDLRQRVVDPVVMVVSNSCSACFYPLLPQDVAALNPKTVSRCRGCYRLLFTQ